MGALFIPSPQSELSDQVSWPVSRVVCRSVLRSSQRNAAILQMRKLRLGKGERLLRPHS